MQADQLGLVVECVDLAEAATGVNVNGPLGPRGMVGRRIIGFPGNTGREQALAVEQRQQRRPSQAMGSEGQKLSTAQKAGSRQRHDHPAWSKKRMVDSGKRTADPRMGSKRGTRVASPG